MPIVLMAMELVHIVLNVTILGVLNTIGLSSNIFDTIIFPDIHPSQITVVTDSTSCLTNIIQTIRSSLEIPITIIKFEPNYNPTAPYVPFEAKKLQLANPLFYQLKSSIVVLGITEGYDALVLNFRRETAWNPRAYYFLIPCSRRFSKPLKILTKLYEDYNIYNAVYVQNTTLILYNPFLTKKLSRLFQHSDEKISWDDIFPQKFSNFYGFQLKICTFHHPPFVIKGKDGQPWEGVEIQILNSIQKRLNFTYKISSPSDRVRWGNKLNGTKWSGLFGVLMENKADLGFGNLFLAGERYQIIEQARLHSQDKVCWAVPNVFGFHHDGLSIAKVFSWRVWTGILGAWILVTLGVQIFKRKYDIFPEGSPAWLHVMAALLQSCTNILPSKSSGRVFWLFWMLFSLLVTATYKSGLISKLSVPTALKPINTLAELDRSGFVVGGSPGLDSMLRTPKVINPLFYKFVPDEDTNELLDRVAKSRDAALLDSQNWLLYMQELSYTDEHENHLIHVAKECCGFFNIGYAFPIGSKYFDTFSRMMDLILQSGLGDKWLQYILDSALKQDEDPNSNYDNDNESDQSSPNPNTVLGMAHLIAPFCILIVGLIASFVVFVVEALCSCKAFNVNAKEEGSYTFPFAK